MLLSGQSPATRKRCCRSHPRRHVQQRDANGIPQNRKRNAPFFRPADNSPSRRHLTHTILLCRVGMTCSLVFSIACFRKKNNTIPEKRGNGIDFSHCSRYNNMKDTIHAEFAVISLISRGHNVMITRKHSLSGENSHFAKRRVPALLAAAVFCAFFLFSCGIIIPPRDH